MGRFLHAKTSPLVLGWDFAGTVDALGDGVTDLGEGAGGFSLLGFLNMGEAPIMFYASIVSLCMWVNSVKMNQWFNSEGSIWFALALAIPNFIFAVLLAKLLLEPVKIYKRQRSRKSSLVGKVCVVKSQEINEGFGRCEVATDSAPIIVNARTENGEVLKQGDSAVIVRQLPEQGFHIVTKQTWE